MDELDGLPDAYATALRLQDAGCTDAMIADRLGIEPEAVAPLLRIAMAKRARRPDAPENA